MTSLEQLWDDLLSCEPVCIRRAWEDLTDEETQAVIEHLRRMAEGPDWNPAQQESAAVALRILREPE